MKAVEAVNVDSKFSDLHINPPFYDFNHAETILGVDFECISEEGFKEFLEDKYLSVLVELRKAFLKKDVKKMDEHSHKLKGAFVYLHSTFVSGPACSLMEAARKKQMDLLGDLYIDLLAKMNIFLEKLNEFAKKINNPISKDFFPKYLKKMNELDSGENDQIKSQYKLHFKNIKQDVDNGKYNEKEKNSKVQDNYTTTNFITNNDIIVEENNPKKQCCNLTDCIIF